jgi:hypothetical protein
MAASLPGEPLIPLEDEDAMIAGSLSLRLAIDETGHVVRSDIVSREGLSDKAVAVFVKAFSSYDYIPARRGGRAVRSEVTMVVGVQENVGESKEP